MNVVSFKGTNAEVQVLGPACATVLAWRRRHWTSFMTFLLFCWFSRRKRNKADSHLHRDGVKRSPQYLLIGHQFKGLQHDYMSIACSTLQRSNHQNESGRHNLKLFCFLDKLRDQSRWPDL